MGSDTLPDIERFRNENHELRQRFLEQRPYYEQLAREIAYALENRLKEGKIEVAAVTSRAKTVESFRKKVEWKKYTDPLTEIHDFAGVRVVCLYLDDIQSVQKVISDEFEVIETDDKVAAKASDQFGYAGTHYTIRLGPQYSGAPYDHLRHYLCEIQVRTVLQDAWAIIGHHLMYKRESDVPKFLQRKLNSLSGLFEIADDQYQQIRDKREQYLGKIRASESSTAVFLANDVNLDTVRQYLKWKFPELQVEIASSDQLERVYGDIVPGEYQTLSDIDELIESEKQRVATVFEKAGFFFVREDGKIPSCMNLGLSLALRRPELVESYHPLLRQYAGDVFT